MVLRVSNHDDDMVLEITGEMIRDALQRADTRCDLPGRFQFSAESLAVIAMLVGQTEAELRRSIIEDPPMGIKVDGQVTLEDVHALTVMSLWKHGFLCGMEAGMKVQQVSTS